MKQTCWTLFTAFLFPFISCTNPVELSLDKTVIKRLESALVQRDTSLITADLSPVFSISTYSWPTSAEMLQTVFSRGKTISRIEPADTEIEKLESGNVLLRVNYYFENGDSTKESAVVFDNDGKIVYLDYFDRLYGMDRYKPSVLVEEIPFDFVDDKIIVTISLNEQSRPLRFLFDTGSDGMAINRSLADSLGLNLTRTKRTTMVGGNLDIAISSGNTVHIGEKVILRNRNIGVFNYERSDADGILGMTLARDYILDIDFDKRKIKLFSPGHYLPKKDMKLVNVRSTGVAVIPATLNLTGKQHVEGQFIFDTGAGFNLVCFENFVRKNRLLLSGFKYDSVGSMAGIGHKSTVYHGKAESFVLGNQIIFVKQMPVTLQASSGKGNWDPVDGGSLGIEFIRNYNVVINLVDKVIGFQER